MWNGNVMLAKMKVARRGTGSLDRLVRRSIRVRSAILFDETGMARIHPREAFSWLGRAAGCRLQWNLRFSEGTSTKRETSMSARVRPPNVEWSDSETALHRSNDSVQISQKKCTAGSEFAPTTG